MVIYIGCQLPLDCTCGHVVSFYFRVRLFVVLFEAIEPLGVNEKRPYGNKNLKHNGPVPQVFQKTNTHPLPPENVDRLFPMLRDLCSKVNTMEKFFQELMN